MAKFWHRFTQRSSLAKSERGITLVEVLVACSLAGLLTTLVVYSNLFVNKLVADWQQKSELEDVSLLSINSLIRDIQNADSLIYVSKDRIELVTERGKGICYEVIGNVLKRNDDELNHGRITLDDLELTCWGRLNLEGDTSVLLENQNQLDKNFNLKLDPDELSNVTGIKIKLKLEGYNKSMCVESFVRLKKFYSVY